jgi:hypothetical protein
LTDLKAKYQEVEEYFFGKESMTPIEVTTIPFEEYLTVFPLGAGNPGVNYEEMGFTLFPSIWPPPNTLFIEWTYTIDLDRELFSVDHVIHFRLSAIPDTWIREINMIRRDDDDPDDDDELVLIPQAIDIIPKLAVDENYIQLYEKANCSILQVEVLSDTQFSLTSVYEGLCLELVKNFMELNTELFSFRPKIISTWGPEDVRFKELAFVLLLLVDRHSFSILPLSSPGEDDYKTADENDYETGVACPATSSFWFAGTFVYLTAHLKDEAFRKSAIGHVLELTKGCPRSNFTAFLFSIRELVVVNFSEEGVKHTETLPFFDDSDASDSVVPNVGLLAMITFLTQSRTSLARHRTRTPTSPSSLPYDILLNIVKYVDWKTTVTLSATSKLLRECVERLGPKLGDFQLLKYDARSEHFLACRDGDKLVKIIIQHNDPNYFNVRSNRDSDPTGIPYLFNVKIRYPGVRQNAFIPPLRVIVSSDAAEL